MATRFKNTKNRSFIFGDFDDDGTANIDDKYPFNKKKKGKTQEISLATELREYKKVARDYSTTTKIINSRIKNSGFRTKYRVKSVNSILNKLRRKRLKTVQDVGGIMILTNSPEESYNAAKYIERNFKIVSRDNYYKKPLNKFYRAIHYVIKVNDKFIEIQIKTSKEAKIHLRVHTKYKEGKINPKFESRLKREVESIAY